MASQDTPHRFEINYDEIEAEVPGVIRA